MRVLITGHEGFIGSYLIDYFDDPILFKGDITKDIFKYPSDLKIDLVINLAAISSVEECEANPQLAYEVNFIGAIDLFEATKCKFINISSAAVYGNGNTCRETDECRFVNVYGETKLLAEECFKDRVLTLRLFNVFGKGGQGVISLFVDKALKGEDIIINGDGEQTRDFIYVKEVCRAIKHLSGKFGVYNIASGISRSINQVAQDVIDVTGSKSEIIHVAEHWEVRHSSANISKLGKSGFVPEKSYYENLEDMIK